MCIPDEWQHLQPGDLRTFFSPLQDIWVQEYIGFSREQGSWNRRAKYAKSNFLTEWSAIRFESLSNVHIFAWEFVFFPDVDFISLCCIRPICCESVWNIKSQEKKTLMWKYAQMWKCLHVKTAETKPTLAADQTGGAGAGQFSQNCGGIKYHRVLRNSYRPAA